MMVGVQVSPAHPLGCRERPEHRMCGPLSAGMSGGKESHRFLHSLAIHLEDSRARSTPPRIDGSRRFDPSRPVNWKIEPEPFHDCAPQKGNSFLTAPAYGAVEGIGQMTQHLIRSKRAPTPFCVFGQTTEALHGLGAGCSRSKALHGGDGSAKPCRHHGPRKFRRPVSSAHRSRTS